MLEPVINYLLFILNKVYTIDNIHLKFILIAIMLQSAIAIYMGINLFSTLKNYKSLEKILSSENEKRKENKKNEENIDKIKINKWHKIFIDYYNIELINKDKLNNSDMKEFLSERFIVCDETIKTCINNCIIIGLVCISINLAVMGFKEDKLSINLIIGLLPSFSSVFWGLLIAILFSSILSIIFKKIDFIINLIIIEIKKNRQFLSNDKSEETSKDILKEIISIKKFIENPRIFDENAINFFAKSLSEFNKNIFEKLNDSARVNNNLLSAINDTIKESTTMQNRIMESYQLNAESNDKIFKKIKKYQRTVLEKNVLTVKISENYEKLFSDTNDKLLKISNGISESCIECNKLIKNIQDRPIKIAEEFLRVHKNNLNEIKGEWKEENKNMLNEMIKRITELYFRNLEKTNQISDKLSDINNILNNSIESAVNVAEKFAKFPSVLESASDQLNYLAESLNKINFEEEKRIRKYKEEKRQIFKNKIEKLENDILIGKNIFS